MKKIFKALNFTLTLLFISIAFIACDEEYSSIESDVLGKENFNFEATDSTYSVIAYNQNLSAQQINGLPSNLLGFYEDPIYGTTTASIVSQVLPTVFDPTFGLNKQIDSVKLTIPYFSTQTDVLATGEPIFKLDSLFVKNNNIDNNKPVKLTIYENRYFLSSLNVNSPESQNYYSNANFISNNGNNTALTETFTVNFDDHLGYKFFEGEFTPNTTAREVKSGTEGNETTSYLSPAMEIELAETETQKAYWQSLILDQEGQSSLSNANNFLDHFRGLYIKAEAVDNEGNMILLNLLDTNANIVINFSTDDNNDGERETKAYVLNFRGNILNTFINDYTPDLIPTNPDTENGDEKLYLKGNEGALTVIELFNDDQDKKIDCNCGKDSNGDDIIVNVTELDCFKKTYRKIDDAGNELEPTNGIYQLKRLLNEAHLVIYEDASIKNAGIVDSNDEDFHKYDRLYIYNLDTNTPILDYTSDPTTNRTSPLFSRSFSLGIRQEDENGNNKYKVKVTDHLNNILLRENADNPKLGLAISNNVNIKQSAETLNNDIDGVPATSVISPRGTILFGSNRNDGNEIKLKLFYTGVNQN